MKKQMILFAFMLMAMSTFAQSTVYYECTGNNVNIRKGPGTNYGVVELTGGMPCGEGKAQLSKGDFVESDGQQRNGFIHVMEKGLGWPCWEEGWVSVQYLKKAAKFIKEKISSS